MTSLWVPELEEVPHTDVVALQLEPSPVRGEACQGRASPQGCDSSVCTSMLDEPYHSDEKGSSGCCRDVGQGAYV